MKVGEIMRGYIKLITVSFLLLSLTACVKDQPNKKVSSNHLHVNYQTSGSTITTQILQIKKFAEQGKVDSALLSLSQNFNDVEKRWGKADQVDEVNGGFYATYDREKVTYGYDKEKNIYDIRSYRNDLKNLDVDEVKKILGEPIDQRKTSKENIIVYQVNSKYQLKFIINLSVGNVDHISVYNQAWDKRCCSKPVDSNYYLSIKGTSNQLSNIAWTNMVKWRSNAVLLAKKYNEVFVNGPNRKKVALTFDDGPDNINTPAIITALAKHHVKGSFFFIGENVLKYPEVVQSAYENGDLILSHSYTHDDLTKKSINEMQTDLLKTEQAIYHVIGKKPAILRPPYGETNQIVITGAHELGYHIVLWSIDTLDWSQMEHENIIKNVLSNVRNGDIILMHSNDDKFETAKAVPTIIEELYKKGFEIVDLSELLNIQAYK